MNLWASRIGQLATLAVALFFFSCQDETSVIGFRNPNSRFNVSFVDIPIESSIYLRDSLRTSNFSYSGEVNRLLVGSYTDETFGEIKAAAFTQFFTSTFVKLGNTAEFDSVTLQLRFDMYTYGAATTTPQTIGVYELDSPLKSDSLKYYFNHSSIPFSSQLGSQTFSVDPQAFKDIADNKTTFDTTFINVRIPLDAGFGQRIFESAIRFRDATTPEDSAFVYYSKFIEQFKGIVIKSENTDKIMGFNTAFTSGVLKQTMITVHYHEVDKDSLSLNLSLSGVIGFNQIKADRSATELSAVNQYFTSYTPVTDKRYIESGIGIFTKLDLSNFFAFADTVPNMLINSAELIVGPVETSTYTPPAALSMRVLKDNNRLKSYSALRQQDIKDYLAYQPYLQIDIPTQSGAPLVDSDSVFFVNERNSLLTYSSSDNTYRAALTLFFQKLITPGEKTKFTNYVLYPYSQTATNPLAQSAAKTVNRVVFPKDKIILRVYYTKPTTPR